MSDSSPASDAHASGSSRTWSESASKELVARYGIRLPQEAHASSADEAVARAEAIGFPVVLKLHGDSIAHKTERGLVRIGLVDAAGVRAAAQELLAAARPEDGAVDLLIAEQVRGNRELIAGLVRDPQFGACVLLGFGGILAEAVGDVAFAAAPLSPADARRMIASLRTRHLIEAPFRGEPAVDLDALCEALVGLGRLAEEHPEVVSVDLNPLIVCNGAPIAVDALVEEGAAPEGAASSLPDALSDEALRERFGALFEPRGVVVAGVSSHPGKFGFVTLHNLLRFGYEGDLFPVKPDGAEVLGRSTYRDVSEIPDGAADLVFVCTPNKANVDLLRACAAKGVRAAFVASAGYGEAGEEGKALQRELVDVADELGMLMIGPNGQGVVSPPASMCAQIVAPYPPRGHVAIASQSGNLVSAFQNYAVQTGVGVSRAVSLGNSAQTELADVLEYFAADDETRAAVVYVEGVGNGRRFRRAVERLTARKPLVVVKGGVAAEGKRAAASHTGALASDDRVFDGICLQAGALRAPTVEEAFEWAATFASQPAARGRRTVIFTSVGGWGVLAADACAANGLELIPLPDDVRAAIDELVPPRWSRNNPVDLAGGETRDTIPQVLDLLAGHPEIDAIVHLGLGIQAATASVLRSGPFYPEHGLERIVDFHEKQDARYAQEAVRASEEHGVPILSATELVYADRAYGNSGTLAVQGAGRVCYPSAHRAVRALRALVEYAEFRAG